MNIQSEERLNLYLERVRSAGLALVSQADRGRLIERHLKPSLAALALVPDKGRLIDIGSGGGFPGIPLAIASPELEVVLVESNTRKAAFLQRVSRETTLKRLKVLHLRIEALPETHDKQYDVVTARAVSELPTLIGWSRRFLKQGGFYLFWKGQSWRQEGGLDELGVELAEERPLSDGGVLLKLVEKR